MQERPLLQLASAILMQWGGICNAQQHGSVSVLGTHALQVHCTNSAVSTAPACRSAMMSLQRWRRCRAWDFCTATQHATTSASAQGVESCSTTRQRRSVVFAFSCWCHVTFGSNMLKQYLQGFGLVWSSAGMCGICGAALWSHIACRHH